MNNYKYLDETGLKKLWEKIKAQDTTVLNSAKSYTDTKVGTVSSTVTNLNQTVSNLQTAVNVTIPSTYVKNESLGAANGVATLDVNGLVPSSQLPSYVDDVLEYDGLNAFPQPGETGKIYVDLSTNKTYRWSGSTYVVISDTITLGTTSSTAYAGDKGAALESRIDDLNDVIKEKADINGDHTEQFSASSLDIVDEIKFTDSSSGVVYAGKKQWQYYMYQEGLLYSEIYGDHIQVGETESNVEVIGTSFKYNDSNVLTEANLEAISTSTIEALS